VFPTSLFPARPDDEQSECLSPAYALHNARIYFLLRFTSLCLSPFIALPFKSLFFPTLVYLSAQSEHLIRGRTELCERYRYKGRVKRASRKEIWTGSIQPFSVHRCDMVEWAPSLSKDRAEASLPRVNPERVYSPPLASTNLLPSQRYCGPSPRLYWIKLSVPDRFTTLRNVKFIRPP